MNAYCDRLDAENFKYGTAYANQHLPADEFSHAYADSLQLDDALSAQQKLDESHIEFELTPANEECVQAFDTYHVECQPSPLF